MEKFSARIKNLDFTAALTSLGRVATFSLCLGIACNALPASAYVDLGTGYIQSIGLPEVDIRTLAASLIRLVLSCMGIVLVVQIMHGGFVYMTNDGSEDRLDEAKSIIKNGIIGMIIVASSASIAKFIINAIVNAASTVATL